MHMRSNLGPLHPPIAKACYAFIQNQHQRESVAAQCAISCDLVTRGPPFSICSTNQLLVLRGWPGVLLSSIRLVSRGSSSCVREVWMLQVARSGENDEQANTNSPPPLSTPSTSSSGILAAGPRWEGRRVARRAGRGGGTGGWHCFLDGRVGRLQQRSVLPSINTQVVQPTFP